MDDRERIARLEHQVDLLRRAIGLLTVSGAPTVEWLDKSFAEPFVSRKDSLPFVSEPDDSGGDRG